MEHLQGWVVKEIYHSPQSSYCILSIRQTDGSLCTACGYLTQRLKKDSPISFSGSWYTHSKYGRQFSIAREGAEKPGSITDPREKLLASIREITGKPTFPGAILIRHFGLEQINATLQNPYLLCMRWSWFPWEIADQLAMKQGFQPDSPERLDAALFLTFMEWPGTLRSYAESTASCWAPYERVLQEVQKRLQLPRERIEALLPDNSVAEVFLEPQPGISLQAIGDAERVVHSIVQQFTPHGGMDIGWPNLEPWHLSNEQTAAVLFSSNQSISAIYGPPGTGKTTCIRALVAIHKNLMPVFLAAPTGKAADRLFQVSGTHASTLHRMLGAKLVGGNGMAYTQFRMNRNDPLPQALYVVDESSMIDTQLMASFLEAVPLGSRIVLVGDINQIRPVGAGQPFRDLVLSGTISASRLTHIFRQVEGSAIAEACRLVIEGEAHKFFSFLRSTEAAREISFEPSKIDSQMFNDHANFTPALGNILLCPMNKGVAGADALNMAIQRSWTAPGQANNVIQHSDGRTMYLHDRVLNTRNDYGRADGEGIFNGGLGKIIHITGMGKAAEKSITVKYDERTNLEVYTEVEAFSTLRLAYALSIHKSQGSEWESVTVAIPGEATGFLSRQLLYTALSRARKHLTLVANVGAIQKALQTPPIEPQTHLRHLLRKELECPAPT
jgi:exodeoxyribonuclease V alpha subunit